MMHTLAATSIGSCETAPHIKVVMQETIRVLNEYEMK